MTDPFDLLHYHYGPNDDLITFHWRTPACDLSFLSYNRRLGAIIVNERHLREIVTQIRLFRGLP